MDFSVNAFAKDELFFKKPPRPFMSLKIRPNPECTYDVLKFKKTLKIEKEYLSINQWVFFKHEKCTDHTKQHIEVVLNSILLTFYPENPHWKLKALWSYLTMWW